MRIIRTDIFILSFTHITATDILKGNYITLFKKFLHVLGQIAFPTIAIRRARIRGSYDQNWTLLSIIWLIYRSIQFDSVSHRNHDFPLGIIIF